MIGSRWLAVVALALGATACGLEPPDDLAREVNQYYAAHASEENGVCQSPEIATVTERSEIQDNLVLVRYTYYEPGPQETDWSKVFHKPVPCTGSGERQFTIEQTKLGVEVTGMTGPRRATEPQ